MSLSSLPNCKIIDSPAVGQKWLIFDGGYYLVKSPQTGYIYPKYLNLSDCKLYDRLNEGQKPIYELILLDHLGRIETLPINSVSTPIRINPHIVEYKYLMSWFSILKCFYKGKYSEKSSPEYDVCIKFIEIIQGQGDTDKISFECPAINFFTLGTDPFKFVIISQSPLIKRKDLSKFGDKLNNIKWTIGDGLFQRFPNESNDALLVAPRNISEITGKAVCSDIRQFFRTASIDILLEFLHCLAFSIFRNTLEYRGKDIWVSFHDEPWLDATIVHAKISNNSLGYTYSPYHTFMQFGDEY